MNNRKPKPIVSVFAAKLAIISMEWGMRISEIGMICEEARREAFWAKNG
jgi:hypothetical protein